MVERVDYKQMLLKVIGKKEMTANQVIEKIFMRDLKKDAKLVIEKGWKFYPQLTKLFAPMQKQGLIECVAFTGTKREKVWKAK